MDLGGNPEGKNLTVLVGKDVAANPVDVCGEGTSWRNHLNDDSPSPEGEGGLSGYRYPGGGVESMYGGSELKSEEEVRAP